MKNKPPLVLPKKHFSYSQYVSWTTNPDEYRRHYYEGIKPVQTKEMTFGQDVAKGLEVGSIDPVDLKLTRYPVSEKRIDVEIHGVPVLAFLDTFDPDDLSFRELKTGKREWDAVRVHKHEQLPFYMLCIKEKFGSYHKTTYLDWLETRNAAAVADFDGIQMQSDDAGEIELTGRIETFKRSIALWELKRMAVLIRTAAEEIAEDYAMYKMKKNLQGV